MNEPKIRVRAWADGDLVYEEWATPTEAHPSYLAKIPPPPEGDPHD